jgi:hypothetical protein
MSIIFCLLLGDKNIEDSINNARSISAGCFDIFVTIDNHAGEICATTTCNIDGSEMSVDYLLNYNEANLYVKHEDRDSIEQIRNILTKQIAQYIIELDLRTSADE